MRSIIESVAGREKVPTLIHCAVSMLILTACTGRKEFQKGYDRGASDTVKRQYWIQQNMQKAEQSKAPPSLPDTRDT
jgi:hypothetical protein